MEKKILKVEVTGKDEDLFAKLRDKMVAKMEAILDAPIDYQTGYTVREEAKKLISLGINFAEEKLKKTGIENHLLLAEIEEKYSVAEKNKAEARKINAEADMIVFEKNLKEMTLAIKLGKVMLIGKKGKEAAIFTRQLNGFMEAIENINESQKLLE